MIGVVAVPADRETRSTKMLAYDYPIMGLFWTVTIVFMWAAWWFAAIWSFIDNFRRHDHSGWAKAGWALFIILIPLIGVLAYLIARPSVVDSDRFVGDEYATR
jgi:Phospholipase_D-nuclease N-terminal